MLWMKNALYELGRFGASGLLQRFRTAARCRGAGARDAVAGHRMESVRMRLPQDHLLAPALRVVPRHLQRPRERRQLQSYFHSSLSGAFGVPRRFLMDS